MGEPNLELFFNDQAQHPYIAGATTIDKDGIFFENLILPQSEEGFAFSFFPAFARAEILYRNDSGNSEIVDEKLYELFSQAKSENMSFTLQLIDCVKNIKPIEGKFYNGDLKNPYPLDLDKGFYNEQGEINQPVQDMFDRITHFFDSSKIEHTPNAEQQPEAARFVGASRLTLDERALEAIDRIHNSQPNLDKLENLLRDSVNSGLPPVVTETQVNYLEKISELLRHVVGK